MVYCDLIIKSEKSAVYRFDCGHGKSGEIEFPLYSLGVPKILKEPEFHVTENWIGNLYFKHHKSFLNGIAPEKISYEIG